MVHEWQVIAHKNETFGTLALLGAQIGASDIGVLVDSLLLPGEFRIVQTASVTECPGSIWATPPLRGLCTIAAVAASGRCCPSTSFFAIASCKTCFGLIWILRLITM